MNGSDYLIEALLDGCAFTIAITEASRMEVLAQKYGLHELDLKKLAAIDPTSVITPEGELKKAGGYTDWIIRQYLKRKTPAEMYRFMSEDAERLKNDLTVFARNKARLADDHKDINRIKDDVYLAQVVNALRRHEEVDKKEKDSGNAKKLYDKDGWLVLVPLDREAACKYGRGTRWCTAATTGHNYFDQYNSQGPMYIIIRKAAEGQEEEKWQLHPDSGQYMDASDSPVSLRGFRSIIPLEAREAIVNYYIESDLRGFDPKSPDAEGRRNINRNTVFARAMLPDKLLPSIQQGDLYQQAADARDLLDLYVTGKLDDKLFNTVVNNSSHSDRPPFVAKDDRIWLQVNDTEDFMAIFDMGRTREEFVKAILAGDGAGEFQCDETPDPGDYSNITSGEVDKLIAQAAALNPELDHEQAEYEDPDDDPGDVDWSEDDEVVDALNQAYRFGSESGYEAAWSKSLFGDAVESLSAVGPIYDWHGVSSTGFEFVLAKRGGQLPKYIDSGEEEDWRLGRIGIHDALNRCISAFSISTGDNLVHIDTRVDGYSSFDNGYFNEMAAENLSNLIHQRQLDANPSHEVDQTPPEEKMHPSEMEDSDSLPDPNAEEHAAPAA